MLSYNIQIHFGDKIRILKVYFDNQVLIVNR